MALKDEATCSICGKKAPVLEMSTNKQFEEERCRECMERYGDVPLETLRASLTRFDLDIISIPRDDLDRLVVLQKKKIALNRETDKKMAEFGDVEKRVAELNTEADRKISELRSAKWVWRREKKIERIRDEVNNKKAGLIHDRDHTKLNAIEQRAAINKEIDDQIQVIKAEMEAGARKQPEA